MELVVYVVLCEAVLVDDADEEPEELVEREEDVREVGSDEDVDPDGVVVPEAVIDRLDVPVAGPTWKMISPASASTTMTGIAPRAIGRNLSDVRFISS